jgi:hypothetical protein
MGTALHTQGDQMNTPKLPPLQQIFKDAINWSRSYGTRLNNKPEKLDEVASQFADKAIAAIEAQGVPDGLREFVQRVAGQKPEKPDYWSACGQCERNISDAEDLLASATPAPQAERTALDCPAGVPKPAPIGHCRPNGIVYDLPPLTFTAAHLCEALEFFGGEYGDADDPTQVCIALRDEGPDTDGEMRPRGLYVWLKEYPEEGALHLPGTTPPAPQAAVVQQEPFGRVTVRRLSQRFENHVDDYRFFPWPQPPYLDNADECHTVYTHPAQQAKPQPLSDPLRDDIQSLLFEINRAIRSGSCPWRIEAAFEAYEAARRLQQPAHGIKE